MQLMVRSFAASALALLALSGSANALASTLTPPVPEPSAHGAAPSLHVATPASHAATPVPRAPVAGAGAATPAPAPAPGSRVAGPVASDDRFARLVVHTTSDRPSSDVSPPELRAVQGHALDTIVKTFRDERGGDAALLQAVRAKGPFYAGARDGFDSREVDARPVQDRQVDALKVVVHTFRNNDEPDVNLRRVALEKLGAIGSPKDIADIMSVVRKPLHSSDLHASLTAIKSIMERAGSPVARGESHLATATKSLLAKSSLTNEERDTVIKDVLEHGEIIDVVKNASPTANAVYFLRFRETVPGPDGSRVPIEGVWKSEGTFLGKQKATFNREVSAYEFTRRFSKVDIVPVTVEGVLSPDQFPGKEKPFGVGSIQYKLPGGESIGRGYPDSRLLKPKFEAFMKTPEAQQQMREIRTHLYVLNDPEKLPNSGGYNVHNWGNILATPDASRPGSYKLYIIDNGTGQGALTQFGAVIHSDMLPGGATHTAENLARVRPEEMRRELELEIGTTDAADIGNRVLRVAAAPRAP